jgi:ferrous iron transport protein B
LFSLATCFSVNSIFLTQTVKDEPKPSQPAKQRMKLVLVGTPNVGKSVIFNLLTGSYVTVSNYPGTTVEVTRGTAKYNQQIYEVIDTPGMYSLLPITEEERVTRTLLLQEKPDVVVHVVDAKNLERMLPLTLQLLEAGLPVILAVNMMDEADAIGRQIDLDKLSEILGIPVVGTAAALNRGIEQLKRAVIEYVRKRVA